MVCESDESVYRKATARGDGDEFLNVLGSRYVEAILHFLFIPLDKKQLDNTKENTAALNKWAQIYKHQWKEWWKKSRERNSNLTMMMMMIFACRFFDSTFSFSQMNDNISVQSHTLVYIISFVGLRNWCAFFVACGAIGCLCIYAIRKTPESR